MTKAEEIRRLLKRGKLSMVEIAKVVGCRDAYVRAVKARDIHGGETPADKRWRSTDHYRRFRRKYLREYNAARRAREHTA